MWDFGQEVHAPNAKAKINWKSIASAEREQPSTSTNTGIRLALKEYAYARIFKHKLIAGLRAAKVQSVADDIRCLGTFVQWLSREGKFGFDQATQCDLDRYVEWLRRSEKRRGGGTRSEAYVVRALLPLPLLWTCRDFVDQGLTFSPWNGRTVTRVLDYQNTGENRTEIIPDEVMRPLYQFAVQLTQPDVVDPLVKVLCRAPRALHRKNATSRERQHRRKAFSALRAEVERHRLFRGGGDGEAPAHYEHWQDLEGDVVLLYTAIFVIIAGLSGMRDSEVRSLRLNALTVERDAAGQPKTYKLIGRTFKSAEGDVDDEVGGQERTWVVIKEVHDAVEVLMKLAYADPAFDQVRLFARFGANNTVTNNLRRLLARVRNDDGAPVLGPDGRPWELTSSQFRRSLARWIVWQPFGIVAGKNLFGHARIATTQGYAASEPSWNKLVAKEEAALIDEVMTDLAHDVADGAVAGMRAKELLELLGTAGDRRPDDVLFYLRHHKKELHIGPYSDCFFDPSRAACKRFALPEKQNKPVTSFCSPDRCANACIARRHLPAWQAQADDLRAMLRTKGLNDAQKLALERERTRIEAIIAPLAKGAGEAIQGDSRGGHADEQDGQDEAEADRRPRPDRAGAPRTDRREAHAEQCREGGCRWPSDVVPVPGCSGRD
ncbi:hypothetical protein [uncultured Thiocystis sp.]|uniref:hypothetical protein n=1 Tax=uncultured Thiocystis sp. TaxID=1202134 RepID=UPI0025F33F16|nr:hypothetical protein [uncultured Thiocystis sp.]